MADFTPHPRPHHQPRTFHAHTSRGLSVSVNTASTHARHVDAKLEATDRSSAVEQARLPHLLGRTLVAAGITGFRRSRLADLTVMFVA